MSRSSLILAAGTGVLATLAVQVAAGDGLDAARLVAGVAVLGGVGGGSAGASWYWFRTRSEIRTAAAIAAATAEAERRRHRAERSRKARADVAAVEQARAEALAAERDARPAYVDPYLTPAEPAAVAVDVDLQAGRVEETRTYADADWEDLYAHTVGALGPDAHRYVSTTTAPPAAP